MDASAGPVHSSAVTMSGNTAIVQVNENESVWLEDIRITCPCVLYPRTPHFYIVKLGFTGVELYTLFFYFCSKTYIEGTR